MGSLDSNRKIFLRHFSVAVMCSGGASLLPAAAPRKRSVYRSVLLFTGEHYLHYTRVAATLNCDTTTAAIGPNISGPLRRPSNGWHSSQKEDFWQIGGTG